MPHKQDDMPRYFSHCILSCIVFLGITSFPGLCQDIDSTPSHYSVVGENSFGVWDNVKDTLLIDTLYQNVRIYSDMLFECMFDTYTNDAGEAITLPGPIAEYYDTEGIVTSRNFDLMLNASTFPYDTATEYAKCMGFKGLEAAIKFRIGMDYEDKGMRREAMQSYASAYRTYPEMKVAKERALAIKRKMQDEQQAIAWKIAEEHRIEELERAQREAAVNAISASLNAAAGAISQIQALQKRQAAARTQAGKRAAAATHSHSHVEEHHATSAKSRANNSKASKSKTKSEIDDIKIENAKWWCVDKKPVQCTLCRGSKGCNWCSALGKVGSKTCNYCHGSGKCTRCGGSGTIIDF